MFCDCQARWICRVHSEFWKQLLKHQIGVIGGRVADLEISSGWPGQFVQLQCLVIPNGSRWIKKEQPERVPRKAVIAQEALQVGLFYPYLIMDRDRATGARSRRG